MPGLNVWKRRIASCEIRSGFLSLVCFSRDTEFPSCRDSLSSSDNRRICKAHLIISLQGGSKSGLCHVKHVLGFSPLFASQGTLNSPFVVILSLAVNKQDMPTSRKLTIVSKQENNQYCISISNFFNLTKAIGAKHNQKPKGKKKVTS